MRYKCIATPRATTSSGRPQKQAIAAFYFAQGNEAAREIPQGKLISASLALDPSRQALVWGGGDLDTYRSHPSQRAKKPTRPSSGSRTALARAPPPEAGNASLAIPGSPKQTSTCSLPPPPPQRVGTCTCTPFYWTLPKAFLSPIEVPGTTLFVPPPPRVIRSPFGAWAVNELRHPVDGPSHIFFAQKTTSSRRRRRIQYRRKTRTAVNKVPGTTKKLSTLF